MVDTAGAAVAGATLSVSGPGRDFGTTFSPAAVSDVSGAFELRGVAPGVVKVSATHPNFAEGRVRGVAVDPAKGPAEAHVVLSAGGRVEGLVRRRDSRAVTGAAISVIPAREGEGALSGPPRILPLHDDGRFTAEHVPAGRAQVVLMNVSGGQYRSAQSQEVDVRDGTTTSVEIVTQDWSRA